MIDAAVLFTMPAHLEVWLLLGYTVVVLVGARVVEALASAHFARARRLAESGFDYDPDADHYECPQGERLPLHVIDAEERIAVYRAPAAICCACPNKNTCTPHDEGRHVYRPLAEWAETDVGRFHQWLSVLMVGSVVLLSVVALIRWAGEPGTGLLFVALLVAAVTLMRDARSAWVSSRDQVGAVEG